MNDDELITSVRESFTGVRSATPVERIVSRSRAIRARRRTPALAGAAAVLAGTALAVTTLVHSGHPGVQGSGHPGSPLAKARLAAWTVAKQANGDIDIHIRQLKNPAGLQATLRADGVPVNVGFNGQSLKGTCQFYPMNNNVLNAVAEVTSVSRADGGTLFVINPSALPAGAGLAMEVGQTVTHIRVGGHWDWGMSVQFTTPVPVPSSLPPGTGVGVGVGVGTSDLSSRHGVLKVLNSLSITPVYASQQCTG